MWHTSDQVSPATVNRPYYEDLDQPNQATSHSFSEVLAECPILCAQGNWPVSQYAYSFPLCRGGRSARLAFKRESVCALC